MAQENLPGLPGAVMVRRAGKRFCGGVISERQSQQMIKAGSDKRRADIRMFTGTLIEELMATVERAETKILAAEAADGVSH